MSQSRAMTRHARKAPAIRERDQVLAVFADFAENDVDGLVAFLQHCQIDLEPYLAKKAELPDIIAAHFYVRPGVYDIGRVGELLATFPPIAARIRELEAEKASQHCT
jgi:hypothetical protein